VISAWQGLGYNRRARNLHAAAEAIVEHHDGRVPDTLEGLLALPGIGPYTARAVLAFAFEQDVAVVDTNAARFLARGVAGRRLAPREAQELADSLVAPGTGWAHNQGVLDFGATICTKRSPDCDACPLRGHCAWAADGWPSPDPVEGSAGTSARQSVFEGSDRQGRGRLVDALRLGPVVAQDVAVVMGWPGDAHRADAVALTVVRDGLAEFEGGSLVLPS
jgi:A/G-specific adenine glycosylase